MRGEWRGVSWRSGAWRSMAWRCVAFRRGVAGRGVAWRGVAGGAEQCGRTAALRMLNVGLNTVCVKRLIFLHALQKDF